MKAPSLRLTGLLWLLLLVTLPTLAQQQTQRAHLTLEDIWASPKFFGEFFRGGRWAAEGPVILYVETDHLSGVTHLISYNLETDEQQRLIDGNTLYAPDVEKIISIEDYAYSPDGKKVLIFTDSRRVWRLNTKGFYYIYDLETQTLTPLSDREKGYQMFAKFSPDGKKVGFVRNRNLFVVDLQTREETQLTHDGAEGSIINGTFDWVYEEEFGLRDGWQWSPDSRYIAFFQLDESQVPEFVMLDQRTLYPEEFRFKYPKAGYPNSEIHIGIIDMADGSKRFFDTGTWYAGGDSLEYLSRMGWTPSIDGTYYVWMFRMNRDQNHLDLLYGDPSSGAIKTILQEEEPTWIDVESNKITYLKDGKHFVWTSEVDGYRHLYLYTNTGLLKHQITKGPWEVSAFHGVDEKSKTVYFTGTLDSPLERHLYRTRLYPSRRERRSHKTPEPVRITEKTGWHSINMSRDLRYYIDTFSDVLTPPITTLHKSDGSLLKMLADNQELIQTLEEYQLPEPEFFTVPAADGTPLNAYLIKPSSFDSTRTYPLLIHVYGGPGSQEVVRRWGGRERLWHHMLAEEYGVLVAGIDNRGTGGRGKAFKSITYRRLGQLESADQIAGAQYLAKRTYIDGNRLGIWGWSYGGYMTLLSMLSNEGPSTFRMGISVAPVTHWKLYDTIYTERYMSTPQKNPEGYEEGAPVNYAQNMQPHQKLLLVHGDYDDNVHFQNSLWMAEALQEANKPFSMMVYPGRNHGIYGGLVRLHLYSMFTQFIQDHLIHPQP